MPVNRVCKTVFVGVMSRNAKKHVVKIFIPEIEFGKKLQFRCLRLKDGAQHCCLFPDYADFSMNGVRIK